MLNFIGLTMVYGSANPARCHAGIMPWAYVGLFSFGSLATLAFLFIGMPEQPLPVSGRTFLIYTLFICTDCSLIVSIGLFTALEKLPYCCWTHNWLTMPGLAGRLSSAASISLRRRFLFSRHVRVLVFLWASSHRRARVWRCGPVPKILKQLLVWGECERHHRRKFPDRSAMAVQQEF